MNAIILFIIGIPLIEIYLMIKVGGMIGAFNTIFLILFTAITGIYFVKLAGPVVFTGEGGTPTPHPERYHM